jgi:hypothetical protein
MFGVLINVGSSGSDPNGRGRIFKDFTFEYLPIPESEKTREKVPTYREIGFADVRFPSLPVHLDPEFKTFTYGHVKRGFGDLQCLLQLGKNDVLFFYATLQKEEEWSPYIIGCFRILKVYDCRKLSKREILSFKSRGFANNAHLKRADPSVDLLIKGIEGSELLNRAFPIAEDKDCLTLRRPLKNIILSATGKKVKPGAPWYRWTLTCNNCPKLLESIEVWQEN